MGLCGNLTLKICNKRPPSNKRPLPREKTIFGTPYNIRDVYGLNGSFNEI